MPIFAYIITLLDGFVKLLYDYVSAFIASFGGSYGHFSGKPR